MSVNECKCWRINCTPYIKESGNVNDKLEYGFAGYSEVSVVIPVYAFLFMW